VSGVKGFQSGAVAASAHRRRGRPGKTPVSGTAPRRKRYTRPAPWPLLRRSSHYRRIADLARSALVARRLRRGRYCEDAFQGLRDFSHLLMHRRYGTKSCSRHLVTIAYSSSLREFPLQRGHHRAQSRPNFNHGNFSSFCRCIRAVASQAEIKLSSGRHRHRLDVAVLNVLPHFVSPQTGCAAPLLSLAVGR
jgi:hypothetical protein